MQALDLPGHLRAYRHQLLGSDPAHRLHGLFQIGHPGRRGDQRGRVALGEYPRGGAGSQRGRGGNNDPDPALAPRKAQLHAVARCDR
ncbi:hypothetical protein G6F58_013716 [Rhizopus delemar]|nr:hypothetical protein G6F58_013716 [Rhizopus delemar]